MGRESAAPPALTGVCRPGGPPSLETLDQVWQLADDTLRAHGSGLLAELAWATMRSIAWAAGHDAESPVTEERLRGPSPDRMAAELVACDERLGQARSRIEHAQWTGVRDALRVALSDDGPFWWAAAAGPGQ